MAKKERILQKHRLDRTDVAILAALQADARLSNQKLAEQVGLSASVCWRRVRRLQESGAIKRFVTLLDPASVGLDVTAYLHVSLENHHPDTVAAFDRLVAEAPEIMECYAMSGQDDYLLRIVTTTLADYEMLLTRRFMSTPGLRTANTSFVLKQKKYTTARPVRAQK